MITIKDTTVGIVQDIQLLGNTVQDINQIGDLADIRSVGDKVEGQELYKIPVLSTGKNLMSSKFEIGGISWATGKNNNSETDRVRTGYIRVKPNTKYIISEKNLLLYSVTHIFYLNKNKEFISLAQTENGTPKIPFSTPSDCFYIRLLRMTQGTSTDIYMQLEEGTVATPYEPYQEDKLTILSPVQLEKVGDVRDKIIEKDGVWGVEKNIDTVVLNGNISWNKDNFDSTNCNSFWVANIYNNLIGFGSNRDLISCISPHFQGVTRSTYEVCDFSCISLNANGTGLTIKVPNTITTSDELNVYLASMNMNLKVGTNKPQFIPLPHDQQVKLRTFAGQTNIHFETEIQGTIKARIPKSLGASIESLVNKSESTDKRLEIIENVVEGQNMQYSTNNGIIHCTNTKKGKVKDLVIEGNTLVNYAKDGSKTLTLNGEIDEKGTHITTTNAVNNGLVDVAIEGETLVNVCNQKDPVAITKSYTVENTNHVPLQGEYDGKCRPVVEGRTLVNLCDKNRITLNNSRGNIDLESNTITHTYTNNGWVGHYFQGVFKENTVYTMITYIYENTLDKEFILADASQTDRVPTSNVTLEKGFVGLCKKTFMTKTSLTSVRNIWTQAYDQTNGKIVMSIPIILEGNYVNTHIPEVYFKGLKSSFEDQFIPQNLITSLGLTPNISQGQGITIVDDLYTMSNRNQAVSFTHSTFGKKHTMVVYPTDNSSVYVVHSMDNTTTNTQVWQDNTGTKAFLMDNANSNIYRMYPTSSGTSSYRIVILEGDYTSNPPTYEEVVNYGGKYKVEYKVTGKNKLNINSSPDMLNYCTADVSGNSITLTQTEVVSSGVMAGWIIPTKLGVDYTFKGAFNNPNNSTIYLRCRPVNSTNIQWNTYTTTSESGNLTLKVQGTGEDIYFMAYLKVSEAELQGTIGNTVTWSNLQVEEGTTATKYEEYKEYTKTFYLNSPLLEGDTIEDINGKATHVRRYKQVVLDGSENIYKSPTYQSGVFRWPIYHNLNVANMSSSSITWTKNNRFPDITANDTWGNNGIYKDGIAQNNSSNQIFLYLDRYSDGSDESLNALKEELNTNPVTVVYKLASPIYETISEESILCDSYVNGHLDLDTNVTVNKVTFPYFTQQLRYVQPNTKYTIQFESDGIGKIDKLVIGSTIIQSDINVTKGINRVIGTTGTNVAGGYLDIHGIGFNASNISVVATEREFDYFEGLYSVGQDNENGHNIEITSKNKNLLTDLNIGNHTLFGLDVDLTGDVLTVNGTSTSYGDIEYQKFTHEIILKPNTNYTIKNEVISGSSDKATFAFRLDKFDGTYIWDNIYNGSKTINSGTDIRCITRVRFYVNPGATYNNLKMRFQVEEGDTATSYVAHKSTTKTLTLNEPLRGLPNGVKDKIVKIGGKWYVERNCGGKTLTASSDENWKASTWNVDNPTTRIYDLKLGNHYYDNLGTVALITSDKFKGEGIKSIGNTDEHEFIVVNSEGLGLNINKSRLSSLELEGFKQWLQANPVTIVYQLATPTYEELEVEPVLTTYVDQTHISTNSVIPCDMTVKNSGYDVIIKPSTLYTVALDTSGEVELNLGGSKVTTNNGVAKVITPSTLVDDSLRISGKGLTSSNVRLLEGDNTHFIPNYFEGLKSSFEDTKQGDNHIVEVVSESGEENNKIQFSTLAPLRSVGDIKDRVVYKDNKWTIERNCGEVILDGSENWAKSSVKPSERTVTRFYTKDIVGKKEYGNDAVRYCVCPTFKTGTYYNLGESSDEEYVTMTQEGYIAICINDEKLSSQNETGLKTWLQTNPTKVVYQLATPIYEEIGEYRNLDSYDEGTTIYANTLIAPSHLGFKLSSHVSNIVKDVQDDVSDLKTWRSEVFDSLTHKKTFDSGFTTIEDTKEGVVNEVKIQGRTLVNLSNLPSGDITISNRIGNGKITPLKQLTSSDTLYLTFNCTSINSDANLGIIYTVSYKDDTPTEYKLIENSKTVGCKKIKIIPKSDVQHIVIYLHGDNSSSASATISDVMLMYEKDYDAQNPPSYFEGLKSAGQDVEEIIVESVDGDGNLFDGEVEKGNLLGSNGQEITHSAMYRSKFIPIQKKTLIIRNFSNKLSVEKYVLYDANFKFILNKGFCTFEDIIIPYVENSKYIRVVFRDYEATTNQIDLNDIKFSISHSNGVQNKLYLPYQSDKKPLLYYNNETQTWEKPVLREWDSIEKHSDGKYYYHKRSEEMVLNGSESEWRVHSDANEGFIRFYILLSSMASKGNGISDKFTWQTGITLNNSNIECIGSHISTPYLYFNIFASKLSTQDVQGFKQWLQANPTTVVYQLAQEEVYEVANIELNSYDGETNIIVNSGVISPITTVSLTSNLPQVAENLRHRVRQLEEEVYNYQVVQNLRQLRTFYKSDYANFGIAVVTNTLAVTSSEDITPYGYDLFELFKQIIEEGKDSYDRIELEEYIDFYVMTFVFDFEMAFELFDLIASQHPHSEIEEEEPTIKEEEDLEIDVEMGVIPEEIDPEMGVIPQEPSDEDFEIDVEMGVEHEDFEIDVEMGVVPLEPSTEEDNTDLEV